MKRKYMHVTKQHPTFRALITPYDGYHSAGPRLKTDGRMYIDILKNETDCFLGMLYARYLLEVKLGRRLRDSYVVDHIDGCSWNDDMKNLQEIPAADNERKGISGIRLEMQHARTFIQIKCPWCGTWFDKQKTCVNGKLSFCSRSCVSKYYRSDRACKVEDRITRPLLVPNIAKLPPRYFVPFEEVSTEYFYVAKVQVCSCGALVADHSTKYCERCLAERESARLKKDSVDRQAIIEHARSLYIECGHVPMCKLAERVGYTDKGLAKVMLRLFGKPHKEVIKMICGTE
ncbi:MAG: hypothetical protein IKA48_01425 [Fibrobacter sp.]|nr:hypothetical protein [Fibrobacter sp.]